MSVLEIVASEGETSALNGQTGEALMTVCGALACVNSSPCTWPEIARAGLMAVAWLSLKNWYMLWPVQQCGMSFRLLYSSKIDRQFSCFL